MTTRALIISHLMRRNFMLFWYACVAAYFWSLSGDAGLPAVAEARPDEDARQAEWAQASRGEFARQSYGLQDVEFLDETFEESESEFAAADTQLSNGGVLLNAGVEQDEDFAPVAAAEETDFIPEASDPVDGLDADPADFASDGVGDEE